MLRLMTCVVLSGAVVGSLADSNYGQNNSGNAGGGLDVQAGVNANANQGVAQGQAGVQGQVGAQGQAGAQGQLGARGQAAANGRARNPGNGYAPGNSRQNWNPYSINQNPWFNRDAVRQELGINNDQYNRMNDAYTQTYNRYRSGRTNRDAYDRDANNPNNAEAAERERARAEEIRAQQDARARQRYEARRAAAGELGAQGYLPDQDQFNRQFQRYGQFARDYSRATAGTLDQMQTERYNQLQLQRQGIDAFRDPSLQAQLELTDKQKGELQELYSTYHKAMWEYGNDFGDLERAEAGERFRQIRDNSQDRLKQILSEEQNKMWSDLTGEPFEFSPEDFNYRASMRGELNGETNQRAPY